VTRGLAIFINSCHHRLPPLEAASGGGAVAAAGASFGLGVLAVVLSSLLSGFANVYFEKIVKTTAPSLWVRVLRLTPKENTGLWTKSSFLM